jgi:hypothetical protein
MMAALELELTEIRANTATASFPNAVQLMFRFVKVEQCYMVFMIQSGTATIHQGPHHRAHIWEYFSCPEPLLGQSHLQDFSRQTKNIALLDKVLDLLQPAKVFLLLLDIDVLGDEDGEIGVDAPLVEVGLEESLQVLVELREGRAGVHLLGGQRLVGDLGLGEVGGGQVSDGLDLECAAVGNEVDAKGARVLLAGSRDQNVDVGRECGLGVVLDVKLAFPLEYQIPYR